MTKINLDSFSHGQIISKLWLCQTLEKYINNTPQVVYVLGCWHGLTGFLLESRGNIDISSLYGIDLDSAAIEVAKKINVAWVYPYKHHYIVADANNYTFAPSPDIVINTSAEHFTSDNWFKVLAPGTLVAVQESKMPIDKPFDDDTFYNRRTTLKEFDIVYPMSTILFLNQIEISYPEWSYIRYMKIGII